MAATTREMSKTCPATTKSSAEPSVPKMMRTNGATRPTVKASASVTKATPATTPIDRSTTSPSSMNVLNSLIMIHTPVVV